MMSEVITTAPDFDAMSDDDLARWHEAEGGFGMTEKQERRAIKAFRALAARARGFEVLQQPNRIRSKSDKLFSFDISRIHIPPRRRALDEGAVIKLMESIERIGLQTPPSVRIVDEMIIDGDEYCHVPVLVTGRGREPRRRADALDCDGAPSRLRS